MHRDRDEIMEVDAVPWDARSMEATADTPLELFERYQGTPLRDRDEWWAIPRMAAELDAARIRLSADARALVEQGIGVRVGMPLAASIAGFTAVDAHTAEDLIGSSEYQMFVVNHRPDPPVAGATAATQWQRACNTLAIDTGLRDALRALPLPPSLARMDAEQNSIRDLAFGALLGKAREELAERLGGTVAADAPGKRLASAYLAGHVPVSLISVI
jgi:hypothetical protein